MAMRILPVPARVGWYDPSLMRRRLDEAQGLLVAPNRSLDAHDASWSSVERDEVPREDRPDAHGLLRLPTGHATG